MMATRHLPDTRTAGVGENHTAELLEGLELTVTLDGGALQEVSMLNISKLREIAKIRSGKYVQFAQSRE